MADAEEESAQLADHGTVPTVIAMPAVAADAVDPASPPAPKRALPSSFRGTAWQTLSATSPNAFRTLCP